MAPLTTQSTLLEPLKLLLLGDSGAGKTGATLSLAKAGYRLYFVDFDNGATIIRNLARPPFPPAAAQRIDIETFRDEFFIRPDGKLVPKTAVAWAKGVGYLAKLAKTLGPWDVIVIDSLSFAGKAGLRWVLQMNNRIFDNPQIQDWGQAMAGVENLVAMLTDPAFGTNVICTSHVQWVQDEAGGAIRGYPDVPGNKLAPTIPKYFNHVLGLKTVGAGQALKRTIHTSPFNSLELKNANPTLVKPTYDIDNGLAEYFRVFRGEVPAGVQSNVALLPTKEK